MYIGVSVYKYPHMYMCICKSIACGYPAIRKVISVASSLYEFVTELVYTFVYQNQYVYVYVDM